MFPPILIVSVSMPLKVKLLFIIQILFHFDLVPDDTLVLELLNEVLNLDLVDLAQELI